MTLAKDIATASNVPQGTKNSDDASEKSDLCSVDSDVTFLAPTASDEEERDEVKEIEKLSSKETKRVNIWKLAVTLAFLLTALAVTVITYLLLDRAEYNNFVVAYDQFARTLADSAIEHQKDLRGSIHSLSESITTYSESVNAKWPFFHMPKFDALAQNFRELSQAEYVGINNIVRFEQREAYINYTTAHYQQWIKEGHLLAYGNLDKLNTDPLKYNRFISRKGPNGWERDIDRPIYQCRTTLSPPPRAYGPLTNWNADTAEPGALDAAIALGYDLIVGAVRPYKALPKDEHVGFHTDDDLDHPHSFVYYPIHKSIFNKFEVVGSITAATAWDVSMRNLLPDNVRGIFCVIRNNCNQSYSYRIDGQDAFYEGEGDSHDKRYDHLEVVVDLALHANPHFESTLGHCMYSMSIYPSTSFEESYDTKIPEIFAAVVASTFILVSVIFFVYDVMVRERNAKLIMNAAQTSAIITGLFPEQFRDRLMQQNNDKKSQSRSLSTFLSADDYEGDSYSFNADPLADLFLDTTVVFADIAGFTAWSSAREPTQVFRLLEAVYCAFDRIAKRLHVFKVETVGDCYVGVCGLPTPRDDHALVIAMFAREIMKTMKLVTRKLEVILGPDTGDLDLRIGIHSGPVTGGVLRGDRSRFQLFGDTVNTCAHIESNSWRGKAQLSAETANHLRKAGKESWLTKREGKIPAKGKGCIETYWLKLKGEKDDGASVSGFSVLQEEDYDLSEWGDLSIEFDSSKLENEKHSRLIKWNVEMLRQILKQIVCRRNALSKMSNVSGKDADKTNLDRNTSVPLEEVKEIISLPKFNSKAAQRQQNPDDVELPWTVITQLQDYVRCIANMYKENPFHNFEHASHVVMSVTKLMSRIVAPKEIGLEDDNDGETASLFESESGGSRSGSSRITSMRKSIAATLHDHTYGITSDPLTQFACAFSALIHDVDHQGVPNPQLMKEDPELALRYKNRSVAEQNSFDLAWNLLMKDSFNDLRNTLCATKAELARFRSLVINSVMATDLGDKELKALRNARWEKAFSSSTKQEEQQLQQKTSTYSSGTLLPPISEIIMPQKNDSGSSSAFDAVNRKATIVIEHIIQASDVSHTMQHWHVYRKWNECLFREIYQNYRDGRCKEDPSETWYKGEIGFFDFYIIPLAKKLKECGVFGISSDEYLNYAVQNREEWEKHGEEVVAEMITKVKMEEQEEQEEDTFHDEHQMEVNYAIPHIQIRNNSRG